VSTQITTSLVMDSRDIARITGKRHDNVCRDIEAQLGAPGVVPGGLLKFEDTYKHPQNGQKYRCYKLPHRECLILATGYDVTLRARLIDRWAELEAGAASTIKVPQTFAQALRLAADQADKIQAQKQQLQLQRQTITAQKPAVEFTKAVTASDTDVGIQDAARILNVPPMKFVSALIKHQVLFRRGSQLVPHAAQIQRGRLRYVEVLARNSTVVPTPKITQVGMLWLQPLIQKWLVTPVSFDSAM